MEQRKIFLHLTPFSFSLPTTAHIIFTQYKKQYGYDPIRHTVVN